MTGDVTSPQAEVHTKRPTLRKQDQVTESRARFRNSELSEGLESHGVFNCLQCSKSKSMVYGRSINITILASGHALGMNWKAYL
jgi:hypothetical protein